VIPFLQRKYNEMICYTGIYTCTINAAGKLGKLENKAGASGFLWNRGKAIGRPNTIGSISFPHMDG
jgi:hypothetical protein